MNSDSLYDLLGIPISASNKEIKLAYRRLAMRWHPDRNPENTKQAEQYFKKVKAAYETLTDIYKRRNYDESLNSKRQHRNAPDSADVWTPSPVSGKDAFAKSVISLEQALSGCVVEIAYSTDEFCNECKGNGEITPGYSCQNCKGTGNKTYANGESRCRKCSGSGRTYRSKCKTCRGHGATTTHRSIKVKLPSGVYDGCLFTIQNKGGKGQFGGPDGSIFLTVSIKCTGKNRLNGSDVIIPIKIDFVTAILGGIVKARTPAGYQDISIPELTRSGDIIHVENAGLRSNDSTFLGRMSFEITLDLPRKPLKITEEIRDTLKALR